jgi:Bax protein
LDRPDGASYEVARFASPAESVGSYMRNLNTGRSYQLLRRIRAGQRARGLQPDAAELAAGLIDYSERGSDYVDEIRAMLRVNAPVIATVRDRLGDPGDQEG